MLDPRPSVSCREDEFLFLLQLEDIGFEDRRLLLRFKFC